MGKFGAGLRKVLGLEKQSPYVREYFYASNMRANIYMSAIIIFLECWMIVRTTRKIIIGEYAEPFSYYFDVYYKNYFLLLGTAVIVLLFSVRFLRGKKDSHAVGQGLRYFFCFICIYFGIKISINDYSKGEQILTFLTMIIYAVCMQIWKPLPGIAILTASYAYLFWRLSGIPAHNTGLTELTSATKINGFTMWLGTALFSFANYNRILMQALKDEHLEEINAHLNEISVKDELTGIHNMLYFRQEAEKMLGYVTTDSEHLIYLFLDIENFKSYNQKYGFHEGNALLVKIAQTIETAFKGSLVARFSDDHFVVLTSDETCMEQIGKISEQIKLNQGEVHLDLKVGAYKPDDAETDPSVACDRARFACNSIKKHYDRSFRYYDKTLEKQFRLKHYVVNHIDSAIEQGHIKVFYQPIVSTQDGCVCGLEALARWDDPQYGLLPPGMFIETLEEYRQIYKLDQCMIEQVCRDYAESAKEGKPFAPVSLNFSRLDFELCDIVGILTDMAKKYGVPMEYLDVEVTESALADRQDLLPNAIRNLRKIGYKVWLDDFGSGYSSLNVLKDYQFDVLKIDMQFLAEFGSNEKTMPILTNVILLSKKLNMLSLTEGVETQEQFDFLRSVGCDRAQGYLFSKPVPLSELYRKFESGELRIKTAENE